MALDRITLSNFRNHTQTRIDGTRAFNLLIGENGAGKTNILEALSLLAPGRGLRRATLAQIVRTNSEGDVAVTAELSAGDGGDTVALATGTRPGQANRRIVRINGAEKPALELGEWLSLTWLTPAMDSLFTDSAGARRRFLDRMVLAVDPAHARTAARYENALRERNRLLSDEMPPDPAWLDGIEAQMAETAATLISGRSLLVDRLIEHLAALPDEPFARPALSLEVTSPDTAGDLIAFWRDARGADRKAGRTLAGPHRDDLVTVLSSKDVPAALCSTGEQKAMLIAITLAHAEIAAGERPQIMLLDEVAAHLDPVRRKALFERLAAGGAQVWITATEMAPFSELGSEAAVWRVTDGEIEPL